MSIINQYFKDFYYRNDFVSYARYLGAEVGTDCRLLCNPRKSFGSEPWLIKIGDHVEITSGCRLLTHDGSTWVIREKFPNLAVWGSIVIGNNVFVGVNSIIMPNVVIGDNCVIGAGSVVTHDISDNSVAAGSPARVISDYKTFSKKIRSKSISILQLDKAGRREYCIRNYPWIFPGEKKEGENDK